MTMKLIHGMGENFVGPCDLIMSQLYSQLNPRVKGTPMILLGPQRNRLAYTLWSFAELTQIAIWGRNKKQAVWVANAEPFTVDTEDLVEEEVVAGCAWFPLELPRRLLAAYPGKKDVVVDPFMGRGTVGKAAIESGGDFIGIDRDRTNVLLAYTYLGCESL